jgi:hypothetical protein
MQQFHEFICRSTCFGRLHTHHQELKTALTASGFTLERDGNSAVGRGLTGYNRPDNSTPTTTFQGKTRGC